MPCGTAPPAQEGSAIGERIPLYISASDPVCKAGVAGQLHHRPEIDLLDDDGMHRAVVAIVAGDEVDDDIIRTIRVLQRGGCSRVVLVVPRGGLRRPPGPHLSTPTLAGVAPAP